MKKKVPKVSLYGLRRGVDFGEIGPSGYLSRASDVAPDRLSAI